MIRRKQHKISMLAMEKLIEDLYKPYVENVEQTKDVPKDIEIEPELDKFGELF